MGYKFSVKKWVIINLQKSNKGIREFKNQTKNYKWENILGQGRKL